VLGRPRGVSRARLLVAALIVIAIAAFFAAGGQRYLSFDNVKAQVTAAQAYYEAHPLQTIAAYCALYVLIAAANLPGAVPMTLAGGALFGLLWGTVIVSFASSLGATLGFLASRLVLRAWVQGKFASQLQGINEGFRREGGFYLFTLRLIPAVPFFVINLAMGLTPIRTWTFYWVSQIGMLAGTLVYVNAGTQLARLDSPRGILSWELLGAFLLLGIFPLIAKKLVDSLKARRVYSRWIRPQSGGDRRGIGRAGLGVHRRDGAREGHADREAPHGWRLPQHRLRAVQGAAQDRARAFADPERIEVRHPQRHRGVRFRRGHGARAARGAGGRASRFGRAL